MNLLIKEKKITSKLHDSVDYNNLKYEYVGLTKDVSFYKYKNSKELFNVIKDNKINFDDTVKRQNELLNKISNAKIGKKTDNQKKVITNLENVYISREEVINFFRDYGKMVLDASYKSKKMKLREEDLRC